MRSSTTRWCVSRGSTARSRVRAGSRPTSRFSERSSSSRAGPAPDLPPGARPRGSPRPRPHGTSCVQRCCDGERRASWRGRWCERARGAAAAMPSASPSATVDSSRLVSVLIVERYRRFSPRCRSWMRTRFFCCLMFAIRGNARYRGPRDGSRTDWENRPRSHGGHAQTGELESADDPGHRRRLARRRRSRPPRGCHACWGSSGRWSAPTSSASPGSSTRSPSRSRSRTSSARSSPTPPSRAPSSRSSASSSRRARSSAPGGSPRRSSG